MTTDEYSEIILDIIKVSGGVKSTDLGLKLLQRVNPAVLELEKFHLAMEELRYKEAYDFLEYVLPNQTVARTIYFPKGTFLLGK